MSEIRTCLSGVSGAPTAGRGAAMTTFTTVICRFTPGAEHALQALRISALTRRRPREEAVLTLRAMAPVPPPCAI
jgi:hypothetical protein